VIDPQDYETIRPLGPSGSVYLVRSPTGLPQVMKSVHCGANPQQFGLVIEAITELTHPALLQIVGYSLPTADDPSAAILTDYIARGSLHDIMHLAKQGRAPARWDLTHKLVVIFGVAAALRHLHERSIVHGNLKPSNVFLADNLAPQVSEFGLATIQQPKRTVYTAPESTYGPKFDVYAFGVLAFEVLSASDFCESMMNRVPSVYAALIRSCCAAHPNERPTFEQIAGWLATDEFVLPDCDVQLMSRYRLDVFPAPPTPEAAFQGLMQQVREQFRAEAEALRASMDAVHAEQCEVRGAVPQLRGGCQDVRKRIRNHEKWLDPMSADCKKTGQHLNQLNKNIDELKRIASQGYAELRKYGQGCKLLQDRLGALGRRPAQRRGTERIPRMQDMRRVPSAESPQNGSLLPVRMVEVNGTSLDAANEQNLRQLADPKGNTHWVSQRCDNAWITVDFGRPNVVISSYTLMSAPLPANERHLKSWVVEFSPDGKKWTEVHRVDDVEQLNGPSKERLFGLESSPPCQIVRLRQTGPSHAGHGAGFALARFLPHVSLFHE
jgi:serine/threonine protein kinase